MTQQDERPVKYKSGKENRPRCPVHGVLMRVESSKGPVGYVYCPVDGCCESAKCIRKKYPND